MYTVIFLLCCSFAAQAVACDDQTQSNLVEQWVSEATLLPLPMAHNRHSESMLADCCSSALSCDHNCASACQCSTVGAITASLMVKLKPVRIFNGGFTRSPTLSSPSSLFRPPIFSA